MNNTELRNRLCFNPNLNFDGCGYTRTITLINNEFDIGKIRIPVTPLVNLVKGINTLFLVKENRHDALKSLRFKLTSFDSARIGTNSKPLMSTYYYLHGYTKLGIPKLLYVLCLKNEGLEYFENSHDSLEYRTIPLQHLVCYMDSKAFKECGHSARIKDIHELNSLIASNLEVIDKENLIEHFLYGK
jgi:hypothetical protein